MSEKNEWKSIESAPKDGQSILGWGPCQDAVVIAWNEWAQPEPTWEAVGLEVNGFECPKIVLRGEPTLWQPLPDEPSKYAGDHDGMENEPMAIWAAEQREATPAPSAPGDAQDEHATYSMQPTPCSLQPVATAFFTEKGEVAYTGIFDRTLKALESVKTTRMGISAGSIDLYAARASAPAAGDVLDRDQQRLALWQAIRDITIGNLHDDKLILANLHKAGYVIALAAQVPHKGDAA